MSGSMTLGSGPDKRWRRRGLGWRAKLCVCSVGTELPWWPCLTSLHWIASLPYERISDLNRSFSHQCFPFAASPSVQGALPHQASWSEYPTGNAETHEVQTESRKDELEILGVKHGNFCLNTWKQGQCYLHIFFWTPWNFVLMASSV